MSKLGWLRRPMSIVLVLSFSSFSCVALGADDSAVAAAAILRVNGNVRINGTGSRETMALFTGDSVQTDEDSVANITTSGSSVLVMPGTSMKFLRNLVELDGGGVAITTTEAMYTRADDLIVTPVSLNLSKFEVAETDEVIVVAARQGDVILIDGMEMSTVREGQQSTRQRKHGAAKAGGGHIFSGKTLAIIAGAGVAAAAAGVLIMTSTNPKRCVSPSGEKQCK